jgi:preprotein translocase subunit SecA
MKFYELKETQIGSEMIRRMERMVLLHTIDLKWKDHLYVMDQVKDGISLRALGQRDPLVEYKKEGFSLFKLMYASINHETASLMFKLQPMVDEDRPRSVFSSIPQKEIHQEISGLPMSVPGQGPVSPQQAVFRPNVEEQKPNVSSTVRTGPKIGRNDLCSCGSGKKFKKCCGAGSA